MKLFGNTQIRRTTAVVLVWSFALAAGVANACLLESPAQHAQQASGGAVKTVPTSPHVVPFADPQSKRSDQPAYTKNIDRSVQPACGVMVGICTHLGCIQTFPPAPGATDLGAFCPGGFYCPCHSSKFDLVGREFKNVPAPTNLTVPPHHFASESILLIGVNPGA